MTMAVAALFVAETSTRGQEIPTVPQAPSRQVSFDGQPAEIEELTKLYLSGNWRAFLEQAHALRDKTRKACSCIAADDYVVLVWLGTIPTSTDESVFWAVLGGSDGEPYTKILPGIAMGSGNKLWELVLTAMPEIGVSSYYVSKPVGDPLLTQIPDVTQRFVDPLFAAFDRVAGSPERITLFNKAIGDESLRPPVPKPPQLLSVIREVSLPEPRGSIDGTVRLSVPIAPATFVKSVDKLAVQMNAQGVGSTAALSKVRDNVIARFQNIEKDKVCRDDKKGLDECKTQLHEIITAQIKDGPNDTPAALEARARLEQSLRAFVDGLKPTVANGKMALENSPETHLTFGLLTAFAAQIWGDDQRAKMNNNKVTADPLPRALQMVVLNWSPSGFQSKSTRRWNADAFFRPFAGVVFRPDIGASAGASFMVLSNFGFNVGYSYLFISQPEAGLELGSDLEEKVKDAAGNPTSEFRYDSDTRLDPLRRGTRHTMFVGVSYNFK